MTDAALSVTQSAVERFTEQYLETLGCDVDTQGNQWEVTIPHDAETDVATGEVTLICSTDPDEIGDQEALHPESPFFHSLLNEASEKWPTGRVSITATDAEISLPPWVVQSEVSVESADFTPYYDRTAIVVVFRVSIETVSEYQTELLRAIGVDTRSEDILPGLADTVLAQTLPGQETVKSGPANIGSDTARQLIDRVRDDIVNEVESKIDEVHEAASRSADAEIEEYRQLQQQRLEELKDKRVSLSNRIDDLRSSIEESSSQAGRAEALKKRKELKSELEDLNAELDNIRKQREKGFPEKQREIRDRHALEVVIEPVTVTEVVYEQGEIDLTLTDQNSMSSITVGYGSGIGITEDVECDYCGTGLSSENAIRLSNGRIRCEDCS